MSMMNSVLLVEDHPIFRKGLCQLIESQPGLSVAGEAEDKTQALEIFKLKKPDLVLLDLTLGDESGLDLIKDLRILEPGVLILVLSMHEEQFYAERVLHAGARGYIMKQESGTKVIEAIKTVLTGKIWLSDSSRERMMAFSNNQPLSKTPEGLASVDKLSDREFEVFTKMGKGYGTAEIAALLNLSAKTIDTHKEHIKQKLHCKSSQDLRQLAIEWQSNR